MSREIGKQAGRIGRKRMFHAVSSFKKVYMFPSYFLCKGFNPVRQLSTSTDFNCELFLKQCMDLIDKRGHCRIRLGETVLNTKGEPVSFDITYGWPFRHYCKCNFSNDPVSFEQIKEFENSLKFCGIVPTRGIYFSKTPFEFDTPDFDVRCIDEAAYWDLYNNSTKNIVTKGILFSFIAAAMYLLYWTATHDQNEKKKQIKKIFESRLLDWKNVIN